MDIQQAILEKLTKIEAYLYFDKETNTPGMIERLRDLEETIEDIQTERKLQKKVWAIFGAIGGGFVMLVWEIVKMAASQGK